MLNSISSISQNKVTFKGELSDKTKTENQEVAQHKSKSWMLWTGLAALGAVGIYIATRGEKGSNALEDAAGKTTEKIKDMAVDAFKSAGNKFEKGKAKLANGDAYTGNLTQTLKDGTTVVREYKCGQLQKVTKMEGEKVLFSKSYSYDDKGMLINVVDPNKNVFHRDIYKVTINNNDKIIESSKSEIVKNIESGKIRMQRIDGKGKKWFHYGKDGNLRFETHEYMHEGVFMHDLISYYPDGKNVRFISHGYNGAEFYDLHGNVIDNIQMDLARGGESYFYDNLSRSRILELGQTEYRLHDEIGHTKVSLSIVKKPDFYSKDIRIFVDGKRYTVEFDEKGKNIETIFDEAAKQCLSKETDKELYTKVANSSVNAYKEIIAKHKKAFRLRNELQLANREYRRMF